jgi:hypothetical protein
MSPILRAIRSWWLVALLSAGCTSYQKTSLTEIQSHPDKIVNKKVQVHYAASGDSMVVTGRTARARTGREKVDVPDSLVVLRVEAVRYPILTGESISGWRKPIPMVADVSNSRKLEVHAINWRLTMIGLGVTALFIAAMLSGPSFDLGLNGWTIAGPVNPGNPPSPPPPPHRGKP